MSANFAIEELDRYGPRVYADHNATTPILPVVAKALRAALLETGNPSSVHSAGRAARRKLETARRQVAGLVGASPDEVIFTSGGTEADCLALRGSGRPRLFVSAIEHDALLNAVPDAHLIPVTTEGYVDLGALEAMLQVTDSPALVSVMWANNETGVVQRIAEVVALAREYSALVHSDAVQALGKLEIDFRASGLDMMSISAHKIGGPAGVGALVLREEVGLAAQISGGGQERGRRSGTENILGIVGFGAAAEEVVSNPAAATEMRILRDKFEALILKDAPNAFILSRGARRLANTTCVAIPGMLAETQVMALDLGGFAVSAGAACSSGKIVTSHVIEAMGLGEKVARCAIRISWGRGNTEVEVERLAAAWLSLYKRAVETS